MLDQRLDQREDFYLYTGILPGMMVPPKVIYLRRKEVCPRKNCEFGKDCNGLEHGRVTKMECNLWELIRMYGGGEK